MYIGAKCFKASVIFTLSLYEELKYTFKGTLPHDSITTGALCEQGLHFHRDFYDRKAVGTRGACAR